MTTINDRYRGERAMVLRLVLVGMVAALGVTLPSRHELETWGHSAQCWINARMAEWDTRTSIDEGAFVYVNDPAEFAPSVPAKHEVSDKAFAAIVDEMAMAFARDAEPARKRETETAAAPLIHEPATVAVSDSLAIAPPTEPASPELDEANEMDLAFSVAMEEVAAMFATDLHAPKVIVEPSDEVFAAVMEEMAAEFARQPATAAAEPAAQSRSPKAEQVAEVEDPYAGEAYALNRASEGICDPGAVEAANASTASASAAPSDRLTNAVRLTREAVFAWASLLHGPAVVTIAH
jgi:hypothetical protein